MINTLFILLFSLISQVANVDEAIELYLSGDMNGSISALESLLDRGGLSLDDEIRVYHRLGAAYFGIGQPERTETAFQSLLFLDPYYDLGPWENPDLRTLLDNVRHESMATVLIQGEPRGALVFMDGEYVGSTPYIKDNLIGGRTYTFTIMAEGYRTDVQSCSTVPGQLHTMMYEMEAEAGSDQGVAFDPLGGSGSDPLTQVIEMSGSGQSSLPSDTTVAALTGSSEEMSIEQLNALLHGGEQMTALENIGPLNSSVESGSAATGQEFTHEHGLIMNTGSTIDVSDDGQPRMVFSDVAVQQNPVVQTEPGSGYSSRSSDEVREVLASKESAVTFIYNKHLRADPLLSGTVLIEMIIEPSGRVSDVSILDSTTFNPAFDLELASTVETWRFGAVDEDEGALPVTYPFNFSR